MMLEMGMGGGGGGSYRVTELQYYSISVREGASPRRREPCSHRPDEMSVTVMMIE
jgi:hypothetical protein